MTKVDDTQEQGSKSKVISRSPKHPVFGLREAIEKARKVWDEEEQAPATKEVLAHHWGLSAKSSSFIQTVASMRQYGLLDSTSIGEYKLSDTAKDIILLDDDDPRHEAAMGRAAMSPGIFQDLVSQWGASIPSEKNMEYHLVTKLKFRNDAAKKIISIFKESLEISKDAGYDKPEQNNRTGSKPEGISEGDFVQWTSQGVAQFKVPKRIVTIKDGYALLDGATAGVPVNQLTKEKPPTADESKSPADPFLRNAGSEVETGSKREVFALDEGQIVVQWPDEISKDSFDDVKEWLAILERKIGRCVRQG